MSQQKILLIDYDPASIRRTATPLTKAGYQVEVAKDGVTGLAAFDEMHPDLVLVEAMLPKKHGFEVCQEIKAKADGSEIPVLITTAVCRGRKYRMDALQIYGCDEYIEKPIADAELVAMIGRFLSAASEAKEAVQEDLAAAIDAATPPAATTPEPSAAPAPQAQAADVQSPDAIESMSDDEIEAKIDALLLGEDFGAEPLAPEPQAAAEESFSNEGFVVAEQPSEETTEQPTEQLAEPSVELQPEPIEPLESVEQPVAAIDATEEKADDLSDEMERRVAAMVEPAPAAEPVAERPTEQPLEEIVDQPAPSVEESSAEATESAKSTPDEWTETATAASPSGSGKKGLIAAAVVILMLGATAVFGWSQGWFGGAESGASDGAGSDGAVQAASAAPMGRPSLPAPVDEMTSDADKTATADPVNLQTRPQPQDEPAELDSKPVEPETQPQPAAVSRPKPQKKGPSKAQIAAAVERAYEAEQQMDAAAGTLQNSLLSESADESVPEIEVGSPAEEVTLDTDQLLTDAVPPPAREGDLVDIRSVDQLPRPVEFEQPAYDELAQRLRQQGTIIVEVLIDESGQVVDARLLQEIPRSRLNDAALRAARRWRYEPAQKDGVVVKVWKSERIIFKL